MNERSAKAWQLPPEALEWLFTLAAIAFLVWQSAALREPDFLRGAGGRYREAVELRATILPQAAGTGRVTAICTRYGGLLPASERDNPGARTGLCSADARHPIVAAANPVDPAAFAELAKARDALAQSLLLPVTDRLSRLGEFENRAREARAETDVQGAVERLGSETRLYREAYGIAPEGARSVPLDCAWDYFAAKYQAQAGTDADRVRALVGMAALLDGDAMRAAAAAAPGGVKIAAACAALGSPGQVVTAAADIVASARASEGNAAKSIAAQELLANAHWYFALWAATGLLLLQFGRRAVHARRFLPLAGLLWAVVGWITHVHVEWLSDRSAQSASLLRLGIRWPDFFQLAIAAAAVLLLLGIVFAPARDGHSAPVRQTPSSRIGYAGFVLFAGLGWWLLLDLSASGHYANRFHALYQQVYVYAAFVLLTLLAPLRLLLAERLGRQLGSFVMLTRLRRKGLRRMLPWAAYAAAIAALLLAAGVLRKYQTQLTSEVFRLWLVLGVSWFFFVRGETALAMFAGGAAGPVSARGGLPRFAFLWPLFFVLCVPLAGLVLTDDFGPLFVMLYAASIFFGTAVAFAFFDRVG